MWSNTWGYDDKMPLICPELIYTSISVTDLHIQLEMYIIDPPSC